MVKPEEKVERKQNNRQTASDYNLRPKSILGYADELVRGKVSLHSFSRSDINSRTCFDLYIFPREEPEDVTSFLI